MGQMGLEPFRHLVKDRRFVDVPMILETPKGVEDGVDLDLRNLRTLERLVEALRRPERAGKKHRGKRGRRNGELTAESSPGARTIRKAPFVNRGERHVQDQDTTEWPKRRGGGRTRGERGPDDRGTQSSRSRLVHQPRVELARFQRARAGGVTGPIEPAPRAPAFLAICASNLDEFFEVRTRWLAGTRHGLISLYYILVLYAIPPLSHVQSTLVMLEPCF